MPIDERDKALLYDMLDAALHLQSIWASRSLGDLLSDRTLQWATDRGFNIIGEAARKVSNATKAAHPAIDWRRIVGLRNIVVHDYDEVDYARHWAVIQNDLPTLIAELKKASP
jgi:uncharacterized protein with HEPN domain